MQTKPKEGSGESRPSLFCRCYNMLMATKRNYLTEDELNERLGATVEDAEAKIDIAEQMIDAYVGFQEKFMPNQYKGEVQASLTGKIIDDAPGSQLQQDDDFFAGALVEIIGGAGVGQVRRITASSRSEQSITFEGDPFNPALDATSAFRIYQLGKFPRYKDTSKNRAGTIWYKTIPEAVKAAVAAQVEFMDAQGTEFFNTDKAEFNSERIGNYSYEKGSGNNGNSASAVVRMIAPKAKSALTGIRNITGRLVAGQP